MKRVDVYIVTTIRGPGRGTGRAAYVMKYLRADGKKHESKGENGEYDEATESRLVLYGIREALQRMKFGCEVVIHTECAYVAGAINQGWPGEWERKNWKNSRGEEVKDSVLWSQIWQNATEEGHVLRAEDGRNEYSEKLRRKMYLAPAFKDCFTEIRDW